MYQDYKKIQITNLFNYLFLLFKTQKMEIYRIQTIPLGEKCSYLEFFCLYFRALGLNTFLSVFTLNAGKNGPEKLGIRTLFTQCTSLSSFRNVCKEALSKVVPLKQKYIRVNNGPFMNKHITKTIMKRIRLRNNYLKKRYDGNRKAYNSQRNPMRFIIKKS